MAKSVATQIEVRWREQGTEAWSDSRLFPAMREILVDGLDREKTYEFEWRGISECGAKSDWGSTLHQVAAAQIPPTVVLITATSLADGVHLSWSTGTFQAAGVEYSIERSSSPTTGFNERARIRATAFTDPETSGALFYYRVRTVAFGDVFGGYSDVVSSQGKIVQNGADNSQDTVGPVVINPRFAAGDTGWSNKGVGWAITGGKGVRTGNTGTPTATMYNDSLRPVVMGQQVMAQCLIQASSANGSCACALQWFDASLNPLPPSLGYAVTGSTGNTLSKVVASAPSGAAYVAAAAVATNHTTGTYSTDYFSMTLFPSSLDEVPDGADRYGAIHDPAQQTGMYAPSQNAIANPCFALAYSTSGFLGWAISGSGWSSGSTGLYGPVYFPTFLENVCSATSAYTAIASSDFIRASASEQYSVQIAYAIDRQFATGDASADIEWYDASKNLISRSARIFRGSSTAGVVVGKLENLAPPAGTTYAKVRIFVENVTRDASGGAVYLRASRVKFERGAVCTPYLDDQTTYGNRLVIPDSGVKLGNQLNAPNSLTLNFGAVRSTTALSASSSGAVSINAFYYYMGAAAPHYNAVANAVTGLTPGSTYYIYCHDPGPTGGTQTWLATQNINTLLQTYDDIVVAGQVTVPTSGTSSGGGSGDCVCDHMFVAEGLRAGDAREGDVFDCLDLPRLGLHKFQRVLHSVERRVVECVRLTTDAGAVWEGSASTPFDLPDGSLEWAPHMKGRQVVTDRGIETVTEVERIGPQPVSHIHLGGCSYAAGIDPAHRIYSHNPIMKK
ncbi:MAG TPA: hypothetical protein VFH59_07835 [Frateuria sp.]|uniref:hypothetical protein n=1 Tax=Frateuria sp. TaxID=2211372 RepID=UPI002D7F4DD8|nr:hypothetical protein [Frateuria sp.]HET6805332.1 hypothetical protein [Frateuria sp.]